MDYNDIKIVLPCFLKKDEEVENIRQASFSGYETKSTIPKEMNYVNDTVDRPLNEICHWTYKEDEKNATKTKSKQLIKKQKKNNKDQQ